MTEAAFHPNPLHRGLRDQLAVMPPLPEGCSLGWHRLDGPAVEPRTLLGLLGDSSQSAEPDAVVWEDGEEHFLGWGVAHGIETSGPDRCAAARRLGMEAGVATVRADVTGIDALDRPRWYGGFSFDLGGADRGSWSDFGDGGFALPRLAVRRTAGDEVRWYAALAPEDRDDPEASEVLGLLSWIWRRLEAGWTPSQGPSLAAPILERGGLESPLRPPEGFADKIADALSVIRAGDAEKIVAAERVEVALGRAPHLEHLLEAWSRRATESTRFLVRRGGVAFLGATPERLVRREAQVVQTAALAGTIPKPAGGLDDRQSRDLAHRLVSSSKELHEHRFVVQHLRDRLAPLCSSISVEDRPEVFELRHLLHLKTPIEAVLGEPIHVLDLVQRLHPTPAVGGRPADVAVDWIRRRESSPRGWYAGPVGWFDVEGDGEFRVALRSMLLSESGADGDRSSAEEGGVGFRWASLYAGVGLVDDSVVDREMEEVHSKLLTAGRILAGGVAPPAGEGTAAVREVPAGTLPAD